MLPPVSEPRLAMAILAATAAALPPLLPPGTWSKCQGLQVGKKPLFSVEEPMANSSILSLPSRTAPGAGQPGLVGTTSTEKAEHLARAVWEQSGLRLDRGALGRRGWWGPRQAQAPSRSARRRIVAEAFAADASRVEGRGVLLIDDVSTTMATLSEAARTLLVAGATVVDAWTAARAE